MFWRTRWRLVLWNSLVVACILSIFSISIYSFLSVQLTNNMDRNMIVQLQPVLQTVQSGKKPPALAEPPQPRVLRGRLLGQQRTIISPLNGQPLGVIVWRPNGTLAFPAPKYLTSSDIRQLQAYVRPLRPENITIEQQPVRLVVIPVNANVAGITRPLLVMGLRNISGVVETLQELRWITFAGIVLGVGIAIAIGIILADQALVPIRKAWDRQVQFVADASHELRTPLASIQANSEWLLGHTEGWSDQQVQTVHGIFTETKRLSRLLNLLLTLARSDANTAQIAIKNTDISSLTKEISEQFSPLCEASELQFHVQVEEGITGGIDPDRIRQVLFNLLDNARKFTSKNGQIALTCTLTRRSVQWVISDTGIGINPSELTRIFDRFYQGDSSRSNASGLGLGLSIVKWIVEAHGGSIHVRSQEGQGSQFIVLIPLRIQNRDS